MIKRLGILAILLIHTSSGLWSHTGPSFSRIGLEDGLSHSRIYALLEDNIGYLWVGTSNGLNRYDGKTVRQFKHRDNDPTSLPDNYVTSLVQDHTGLIWVGTNGGGIGILDPYGGTFAVLNSRSSTTGLVLSDDRVWGLMEDRDGAMWVGTSQGGIMRISPDRRSLTTYTQSSSDSRDGLTHNNVWPIVQDVNGDIWIGTDGGGLNRFIPSQNRFIHYTHDPQNNRSISSNDIFSLYLDRSGTLWIGTAGGGLNRFERSTGQFHRYVHQGDDEKSLSNNTVRSILEDSSGNFWIGTTDGLNKMNRYDGSFTRIFHNPNDRRSLSNSRIHTIIEDSSEIVWIGTRDGLNRYIQPVFTPERFGGTERDIPLRNDVRSILPGNRGMFVGSFQGIHYSAENGTLYPILEQGIGYDMAFLGSTLAAGTDRGLFLIDPTDLQNPRIDLLTEGIITVLHVDVDGILWMGSENRGLGRYNPTVGTIRWLDPESPSPTRIASWAVHHIADFNTNHIILGLRGEPAQLIHRRTLEFTPVVPGEFAFQASVLAAQPDGTWWFAPEQGGLVHWNPRDMVFTRFTERQGLPSDLIKSLALDHRDSLWFSTIRGIGRLRLGDNFITSFGLEDGLPGLIYNPLAVAKDHRGMLLFGSTEGIARVDPSQVRDRITNPRLAIEIFDTLDRESNLYRPGQEVVLEPGNRILVLRLTAFDYLQPDSIRYSYRFTHQNDWTEIGSTGELLFSNLSPGTHKIQLRSSNPGGVWAYPPEEVTILVRYPFFLQWYMLSLYGVFFVSGVYTIIYIRGRQHKRIIREQEAVVQERTKELLQAKDDLEGVLQKKSRFFINLAHETKTPLTFIQNYLDRYIETHPRDGDLLIVKDNVDKLVRDMVNYLDTEKIRKNSDYYNHDQVVDLNRIIMPKLPILTESARLYDLKLQVDCQEDLPIAGDPLAVERVVNNLVDNAIKYNRRGGELTIEGKHVPAGIQFTVRDTGPGIGSDQLESLCDPFFQLSHPKQHLQGIGMGLYIVRTILESMGTTLDIRSTPGEGSCFTVVFPRAGQQSSQENPGEEDWTPVSEAPASRNRPYRFRMPPPPKPENTPMDPDRLTLLLVDDDTDMLRFLGQSLGQRFNLFFATSGEEVLDIMDSLPLPDMVVSDIMMDGMNGHELLERLQTTEWRSVPFIFLSAKGDQEEFFQSFNQGAMDFIPKPFRAKDLIGRIEARLSGQERRRSMLIESVQQRIAESLKPLRTARDLYQDKVSKRSQMHQILDTSPREQEILELLVQGKLNKEIGAELGISVRTVEKHIANLYKKAGVQNKVELVNKVLKMD